ncbi:hypothetical protein [Klebsiella pneumoniae]|uniref:hypothetical protein n=1 Tax=Klebsiella pneumoniae TaxID=573 RepID=UPI000F6152F9|nr:hypothetical protein [Klebsiella pneumoniae]RRF26895.1 hypothetical protein EAN94_26905 [Klebsiella pneumoniae]
MRGASSSENSIQGQSAERRWLTLINKLYGIERDMEEAMPSDTRRASRKAGFLEQLKARLDKTPPGHVVKVPWASNQLPCEQLVKLIRYIEGDTCPSTTTLPSERRFLMYI